MKDIFKKFPILSLVLFLFATPFVLSYTNTERVSKKERPKPDTTRTQEGKLPSKAPEIHIDKEGIRIRTDEGKELKVDRRETEGGVVIDDEGIQIGDLKIDLKELKNTQNEMSSREKSKKVYTLGQDIVKMGRNIVVEEYEEVDGDVVAIGGDVSVKGTVTGDVVAVGGDVFVASTGIIEGDAVSLGGEVEKEAGAVIRGERVGISFLPKRSVKPIDPLGFLLGFPSPHMFGFPPFFGGFKGLALFARIIKIIFFLFLGIVVISVVPKNVSKVKDKIRQDFLKSVLVGFAAEILILPIFLLLIVTIIGIPVAILVEPLLILVALILGYTGISYFIGEKLREGTNLKPETPLMTLVIGVLALESVLLLARVVGILGDFLFAFSWILTFIGWMIWYVAITVGFGASILSRLGTRPKEVKSAEPAMANSNSGSQKTSG